MTVAGIVAVIACGCAPKLPPNLLLITLDTFRADLLTVYGAEEGVMPNLEAFSRRSIVFENAVTTMGSTLPAHASLFTGSYPKRHGVRWNGDSLREEFVTLTEVLESMGYSTAAFVGMPSLVNRGGLGQGFAEHSRSVEDGSSFLVPGERVTSQAQKWLDSEPRRPFFLWLHYAETHSPYQLREWARVRFRATGYEGPQAEGLSTEAFYSLGRGIPWTLQERRALRVLYEGEAAHLDSLIGDILARFVADDRQDETVVVITADHGQALGEHDTVGHGFLLWQPVVDIPLMLWYPQVKPARVQSRVGIVDLFPTLLEIVGAPYLGATDGRSIKPLMEGAQLPERAYFVESRAWQGNRKWTKQDADSVAVLLGNFKGVLNPHGFAAFDLDRNPAELPGLDLRRLGGIRNLLQRELSSFVSGRNEQQPLVELEPDVERELRALGYLD